MRFTRHAGNKAACVGKSALAEAGLVSETDFHLRETTKAARERDFEAILFYCSE